MYMTGEHLQWLTDTEERLQTIDGQEVVVLEFCCDGDERIMSDWAKHFRNHYCPDEDIDYLRRGYNISRSDYLTRIKFPDVKAAPGPSIRAGDFGEIFVADYLQFCLNYLVPRTHYSDKDVRNESTKGCDIIGFRVVRQGEISPEDALAIFEAKTEFSSKNSHSRLQDAVDGSAKDQARKAESLNAIKQRLYDKQRKEEADLVERFQSPEDYPYQGNWGAVALISSNLFDPALLAQTDTQTHPNRSNLALLIIRGDHFMNLVHELYRRAADEA